MQKNGDKIHYQSIKESCWTKNSNSESKNSQRPGKIHINPLYQHNQTNIMVGPCRSPRNKTNDSKKKKHIDDVVQEPEVLEVKDVEVSEVEDEDEDEDEEEDEDEDEEDDEDEEEDEEKDSFKNNPFY